MLDTIRKLISFLDSRARNRMAILFAPMLAMAVIEMASIGLILPVIHIALLRQTDGPLTKALLAYLPEMPAGELVVWVCGIFGALFVIKNLLLLVLIYAVNRVVYVENARFTARLYESYIARPLIFHLRRNSADILRNLNTGCGLAFEALRQALMIILDGLLMLAAFGLLLLVEPVMTMVITLALLAVGSAFHKLSSPVFYYWGARLMTIEGHLIRWIHQSLATIRDVKLAHAYDRFGRRFLGFAGQRAVFAARSGTAMHIPRLLIETIVVVGFLGVVLVLLAIKQTPGEVVAVLGVYGMAALRLMPSLNRVLTSAASLRERTAYVDELHRDLMEGYTDSERAPVNAEAGKEGFEREIRLLDISYSYPDATHHAVREVSVTIAKGESVGFVGASGAGKTTIVDIVLGLLRPDSGRLLIDGIDTFDNLPAWQRRVGYVPQEAELIDDTLRRNIAFAIDDKDIDEEKLGNIVTLARLDGVVTRLPDGLSSVLGEGGARLSGGERQRVAIARALYRDPQVLVFDEATSSLDAETERGISEAIESLAGERTVLIIAHRLSTVRNCDKLVFMKEGRIVDAAPYDDLVRRQPEFRRLAQSPDPQPNETNQTMAPTQI
jgi:ATP-binding cassette, subfamily B, bacterial PglK